METKKFGSLTSSVDPQALSATVSGCILGASVIIIWIAHLLGFDIGSADVSAFAIQAGATVAFLWTIFGIIRKIVVAIQQKYATFKS